MFTYGQITPTKRNERLECRLESPCYLISAEREPRRRSDIRTTNGGRKLRDAAGPWNVFFFTLLITITIILCVRKTTRQVRVREP